MNLLNPRQRLLLLAAIAAASFYFFVPFTSGSVEIIVQKSSACVLLAILGYWAAPESRTRKMLCLALLCSAAGDAFLAVRSSDMFTQGLGSFLIAHLIYISIFARAHDFNRTYNLRQFGAALIVLFALGMMYLLWPNLGGLKAPVFIYIAVISIMALFALYSRYSALLIVGGAVSFLISDATIAINKFLHPFDQSGPLIWVTYILAQVLITLAVIKGPKHQNAGD